MRQLFKARLFLLTLLLVSVVVLVGCKKSNKDDAVPPIPAYLQIMLAAPSDGMIGAYYSYTLTAANGTKPYTWSIAGGSLPNGLTLNSTTGLISGTPTTAGTFTFTVMVTDSAAPPATETAVFSIKIDYPGGTLQITSDSVLPTGTEASAYSVSLTAVGGTTPYSWTMTSGSLPAGLSLNNVTGQISGTPTEYGTFTFTVQVVDSGTPGQTDSKSFSLTINPIPPLTITTNSPLPEGTVLHPYSVTLTATGGVAPYSWSVLSGSLPDGLNLNSSTGKLSGTPTVDNTFNFTVQVTDSYSPAHTTSKSFTLVISPIPPLEITTTSLPDGILDMSYSETLQAAGGLTPYTWSLTGGVLPDGLSLASNGTISGTPTVEGDFTFTVTVEDGNSPADSASKEFTITILDAPADPPEILTDYLCNGMVGRPYSQTIEVTGGSQPLTWSIESGSLPPGLQLNQNGEITGTPTARGKYKFTVMVVDRHGQSTTAELQIIIESDELWTHYTTEFGEFMGLQVWTIYVDSRERKWVGTQDGVYMFEGDGGPGMEWKSYKRSDGLRDDDAHAITEDWDGNMWFGHRDNNSDGPEGITILRTNGTLDTSINDDIGRYNYCHDMLTDSKGRIWIALYNNVRMYDPSTDAWHYIINGRHYAVEEDAYGTIWLAGDGHHGRNFGKVDGTTLEYTMISGDGYMNPTVAVTPDGKFVWTRGGKDAGFTAYKNIEEYNPVTLTWTGNKFENMGASSMNFDQKGNLWTNGGGIIRKNGVKIADIGTCSLGKEMEEENIVIDRLNNKWMGSVDHGGGLYRYTGE